MIAKLRVFHTVTSFVIGLAVPTAIYFVNGSLEPWAFVLGAAIGFSYWYFGPAVPPL